jgi:hypothetical protein
VSVGSAVVESPSLAGVHAASNTTTAMRTARMSGFYRTDESDAVLIDSSFGGVSVF